MEKLKVIIADDHPIVLVGVRKIIERNEDVCIVGQASSSTGLIELLERNSVDVIITDYYMPTDSPYGDGLRMVEYLRRHFPCVQVLILTMVTNHLILARLHELKVAGVIQKSQVHSEIQVALKAIIKRRTYQVSGLTRTSVIKPTSVGEKVAMLSPKEIEILRLYILGQSVNVIARNLNKSKKTISAQKISAMKNWN